MKRRKQSGISRLALLFMVAVVSGCATHRVNLVEHGTVSIKIAPTKSEYISRTYVYQDDGELMITGNVRTRRMPAFANGGHVDGVVFAPDGTVVRQFSVSHPGFWRIDSSEPSVTARIPLVVQRGSMVCLAYHHPAFPEAKSFDCGQNADVQDHETRN